MSVPEGFGAAATGGGTPTAANTVTVSTYSALKTALNSTASSTSVILISGTIVCDYTSVTLNNKTIIGLPGARLVNNQITPNINPKVDPTRVDPSGIINIKPDSDNIIIRNLIFEGPGAFDVDGRDNLTNEGTNVWVDHCEFQDGEDGNFDNKGKADNVTISWCKFTYLKPAIQGGFGGTNDHRFTDLIGSSKTDIPTDGNYSITFKNCYWAEGCKERMPRARNAELHILNCYYNTSVSGSLAIGLGGGTNNTTCYVENTNFAAIGTVYKSYPDDGGTIGVAFDGCINRANSVTGTVSKPSYSYTLLPVADVANYVPNATCGAGATLQVTSTGVISGKSNCGSLGLNDNNNVDNLDIKYYPTVIDNVLNIEFSSIESGKAIIEIYSPNGSKVYTTSKNISGNEKLELNIANITRGVYICKVQIENRVKTFKLLKG
ncbi:T9SS type A sorting domain-containing protein [Flavobacterium flavigenum]|uniref:pectate lyase family protein n=1 Tax=Flavobacterium flavigenum TaxID=3003258 RepID=UPI0022AC32FC|nr:T9SS type A sorting domain-containing protein [Flavobacterium flavigenum]